MIVYVVRSTKVSCPFVINLWISFLLSACSSALLAVLASATPLAIMMAMVSSVTALSSFIMVGRDRLGLILSPSAWLID